MTHTPEATSSCFSTGAPAPIEALTAPAHLLDGVDDDMTTCPVMVGNPVSKKVAVAAGLYRDFEGERYYFCCRGCGPAFDTDPATHIANLA